MSVRFESANSESASVSAFFTADTAFAVGGWFYLTDLPGTGVDYTILELYDSSAFTGIVVRVNDSAQLEIYTANGGVTTTGSTTLSSGTWYYLWMRRDGTGFFGVYSLYLDESTTAEISANDSLGTDPDLTYGDASSGHGDPLNGRLLDFKWWDADVAASQAASESGSCGHALATDAYSEHELSDHTDLTDAGPGSRNLTASGTLSTEADEGSWSCGTTTTMTADAGSFTVTGTAANLEYNRAVDAEAGSFSVAGTDANLEHHRVLDAEAGAHVITGTDATLTYATTMAADAGSFTITGTAAFFGLTRVADAGSYSITGTDANLEYHRVLDAASGSFAITGTDADLRYGTTTTLDAESGSFAITGTAAGLEYHRALSAEAGSYAITGTPADLLLALLLDAEAGSFVITGTDAALSVSGAVSPSQANTHPPDVVYRIHAPDTVYRIHAPD